jgi:integrase
MKIWRGKGDISPRTAQGYEDLIDGYIVPYIGTKLMQKLGTRELEDWHATLLTEGRRRRNGDGEGGVSARTVGHAQRVLSKALVEAMRHGLVTKNVCTLQPAPKLTTEEMVILTPQEVDALPAQLHGHEIEAEALLALFCGLRRGEVLALREKSADLDEEVIHVRESLEETTEGGLRFKGPKSKAGIRDVKLPAIVTDALIEHRKRLLERRLMLGLGKLTGEDLLFPRWDGSPQSPDTFGRAWSRLAKELSIKVSFHGLRHTHASMLIDHGVDVVTISKRLGHSSPAITLQVYAHLFRKDDGKAAAAINAALGGGKR